MKRPYRLSLIHIWTVRTEIIHPLSLGIQFIGSIFVHLIDCLLYTSQGRVVIKVNPKYLSLNEMYQVANSYPKGSNDFVNVFDIAVRMYPNDEVANLNAAAVSLTKKDLENAIKYMDKANHQTAEFINNVGVYNFLNGDVQLSLIHI